LASYVVRNTADELTVTVPVPSLSDVTVGALFAWWYQAGPMLLLL